MEKHEFKQNADIMIYLVGCAVNNSKPTPEKLKDIDLGKLYTVCQAHILTACAAYALESAGIRDHQFTQAKEKAIRKNILLDAERKKIVNQMEQAHIWYMPLKGAILKDWYPRLGMRQMSDNDILMDMERRSDVRAIMKNAGFRLKNAFEAVDEYEKEPVCYFEMHGELFMKDHGGVLADYYSEIRKKLLKDETCDYGYHFSNEDFYLYMLAHEYKHFSVIGGTGVRSLVDTYIFLRKFGDSLDWDYINAELPKMGITEFELNNRALSMKLFDEKPLTDAERKLLDYHIFSGTYGTWENRMEQALQQEATDSKAKYLLHSIFPSMEFYKAWYPWAYKHKILIPVAWTYRTLRTVTVQRKNVVEKLRYLNQISKEKQ